MGCHKGVDGARQQDAVRPMPDKHSSEANFFNKAYLQILLQAVVGDTQEQAGDAQSKVAPCHRCNGRVLANRYHDLRTPTPQQCDGDAGGPADEQRPLQHLAQCTVVARSVRLRGRKQTGFRGQDRARCGGVGRGQKPGSSTQVDSKAEGERYRYMQVDKIWHHSRLTRDAGSPAGE